MATKKQKKVSSSKGRGKNWLVAVDPFQEGDIKSTVEFAWPLCERAGAHIEAAYVLAPASLNWTGDFSGPWVKKYLPIAEAKMREIFPTGGRPHVIVCKQSGQRSAVKTLVRFAEKKKAECIVIATHGRAGLERWAMGSFAETLILASKIPTLVLNPSHPFPKEIRKILVPTDLTSRSEKYIAAMAAFAKTQKAEVILYHKQDDPLDPIVQQGVYSLGGGWVSMQSFTDSEIEAKSQRLEKLEGIVRRHGVPVSHIFDSSPRGMVEAISKAAEAAGVDLISVLTGSDAWSAALLGSVARGLVRRSPVPILVQR